MLDGFENGPGFEHPGSMRRLGLIGFGARAQAYCDAVVTALRRDVTASYAISVFPGVYHHLDLETGARKLKTLIGSVSDRCKLVCVHETVSSICPVPPHGMASASFVVETARSTYSFHDLVIECGDPMRPDYLRMIGERAPDLDCAE